MYFLRKLGKMKDPGLQNRDLSPPRVDLLLLKLSRNRREGCIQLCAEAIDDSNDGNRDTGRDETILDSGRT
jgi:hypothetical protein